MNVIAFCLVWNQYFNPRLLQAAAVERLLHGESGAEQADTVNAIILQRLGGCVGNVEERYIDRLGDLWRYLVHGVGADQQEISTCGLGRSGGFGEYVGGRLPVSLVLQRLNLGKIHAVEDHAR